jgi:hypothetical protein
MKYTKAYYLILDSLISVVILVVGVILISSFFSSKPEQIAPKHYANDIINLLGSAKINDLCVNTNDINNCECSNNNLTYLCTNSKINNSENTILELIGELHYKGEISEINPLIKSIIVDNKLLPKNFNFSFILYDEDGGNMYYPLIPDTSPETSKLILHSKKIIFGFWEDSLGNIEYWGPYTAEVITWQK